MMLFRILVASFGVVLDLSDTAITRANQDKTFELLEGDQLQPYMDAIELEGNVVHPMDEGAEEAKARDCARIA